MTNEEIVLERMEKAAKSPIHFGMDFWSRDKNSFDGEIGELKKQESLHDRLYHIIWTAGKYATFDEHNREQCHANARRSLFDIKRLYNYYFGDVDIFAIMRELYKLAVKEKRINTMSCWTTQKLVFWTNRNDGGTARRITAKREVGVPVKEWENIGLTEVVK